MPKVKTKFNLVWLESTDSSGFQIKSWCRESEASKYEGYCIICKCSISCANSGLCQINNHATSLKHTKLMHVAFDKNQPKFVSTISAKCHTESHADLVTAAETIWCMKVVSANYSYSSCSGIGDTFKTMFKDSNISKDFSLGAGKASYIVSDGLGPYFLEKMLGDLKKSAVFTLHYDESTTAQLKKQMDFLVRYWSDEKNEIVVRYFKSVMMGHAEGEKVSKHILDSLQESGIQVKNLLALARDGPNVNKKISRLVNEELVAASLPTLVDIGTCNLHVIHNAFGKGIDKLGHDLEDFAIDLYKWFKLSAARREDYTQIQDELGLEHLLFQKHVNSRWLTLIPVLQRIQSLKPSLETYFLKTLLKVDKQVSKSVGPVFDQFLRFFQTEGPLIHLLYHRLSDLVQTLMRRFVKSSAIGEKEGNKLCEVKYYNQDEQLPLQKIEVGAETEKFMKEWSPEQKKEFLLSVKSFFVTVTSYLLKTIPFRNQLLRDLGCLHPEIRQQENTAVAIKRIAKNLIPHLYRKKSESENFNLVNQVVDQWRLYQLENVPEAWYMERLNENGTVVIKYRRIDYFFRQLFGLNDICGQPKYPNLMTVVKCALTLSHGNSDVERGFSINNQIVTATRTALSTESVNGIRMVKDAIKHNNPDQQPHLVPVTRDMIRATRRAHQSYKERLRLQKEEEEKKKCLMQEENDKALQNEQKEAEMHERVQKTKERLINKEASLLKKETEAKNICSVASTLLKEGTEKLEKAIKMKDLHEISVAQCILTKAKEDIFTAQSEMEKVRSEQRTVEKRKNSIITDFFENPGKKRLLQRKT